MAEGNFQDQYEEIKARSKQAQPPLITATPFLLRDTSAIPPRAWLYGHHLIRRFLSLTIAPGGVGKTALLIADAVALTTGRDLLKTKIHGGPKRVWLYNLEDPPDELERRVAAVCQHFGVNADALSDRLFVDSGRSQPLCIAQQVNGQTCVAIPLSNQLIAELRDRKIDGLIVDPFVSSHGVPENDNGAIDRVAKEWGRIAHKANCAVELVHHLRKLGDQEATAEASRGASALVAAARSVRVLNRMTKEQAQQAGEKSHRGFFNVVDDKNNLAPPTADSEWFRIVGVALANGDNVGVVEPWKWPDPFEGVTTANLMAVQRAVDGKQLRQNVQATDWVGKTVAVVLKFDLSDAAHKAKVKAILKTWIKNGALVVTELTDTKGKVRPIIEVGQWAKQE